MRYWMVSLVAIVLASNLSAQTGEKDVELRAEIKSQRVCEVDNEISALLVKFRLRFANGKSSVEIDQPIYPVVLVANTPDDLKRRRYEFELNPPDAITEDNLKKKSAEQTKQKVLGPGEVFEGDTTEITLPIPKTSTYSKFEAMAPGVHYLQLRMETRIPNSDAIETAYSQPIRIVIAKYRMRLPVLNCRAESGILGR